MRHQPLRSTLCFYLLGRLTEGEGFSLREYIGQQRVVVPAKLIQRLDKGNEVTRNNARALMDQLVKRMLPIGPWLSPIDRAGVMFDRLTLERDVLSIALHGQLLEIRREALQVLLVRKDGHRLGPEKVVVPERQQAQENREIAFERSRAEMLIHLVKATQHGTEIVRPDGNHGRETDG